MACTSPPLTLSNAQAGDMALDQAIYHSGTDKIFGVRGQWLFRFNATTAALEASLRFQTNGGGMSTIVSVGNNLYIGTTFASDDNIAVSFASRDIYIINATTFLVTGNFGFASKLGAAVSAGVRTDLYYARGWRQIVTDGAALWGFQSEDGLWSVDPTNLPGYIKTSFQVSTDIAYDVANNVIWVADPYTPQVWVWANDFSNDTFDTGGVGHPTGICYVPLTNEVYFVNGTSNLGIIDASLAVPAFAPFAVSTAASGHINANPYKVKYVDYPLNPLAHRVLIPAFADDTVLVWNPTATPVRGFEAAKTGFTAPFDIVSTPSKNFAVQTGTVGLKEIV